jgi:hypothetical protein
MSGVSYFARTAREPDRVSPDQWGPIRVRALTAFLEKPERHFAWSPMPNFQLTAEEPPTLPRLAGQAPLVDAEATPTPELVARGRESPGTGLPELPSAPVENRFTAKSPANCP